MSLAIQALIFLLCFLASFRTYGSECFQVFDELTRQEQVIEIVKEVDVTHKDIVSFVVTLQKINSLFDLSKLKIPEEVQLDIAEKGSDAYFYIDEMPTLEVPVRFEYSSIENTKGLSKTYLAHPNDSIHALAHEYGHALLDHNLKLELEHYTNIVQFSRRGRLPLSHMDVRTVALHELFADLIAVINNKNNPKTMSKSIHKTAINQRMQPEMKEMFSERDFSSRKNKIESWSDNFFEHGMMAPSRFYIHENYLKLPRYQNDSKKIELIERVFEAIKKTLLWGVENQDDFVHMTPKEFNKAFIGFLENNL